MSELLALPFLACLVLTGMHAYLGLHVLARGVIFVDLALAQVAGQLNGAAAGLGLPATTPAPAALFGNITMTGGVVDQGNFDTYRVLRNSEAPTVETYIVPSTAPPSGVGEPGTPVIGPAVANAMLAITGQPTLSQPFVKA